MISVKLCRKRYSKRSSLLLFAAFLLLTGCRNSDTATFKIDMEMTENYSDEDPFINARLFSVDDDIEVLELAAVFQLQGKHATIVVSDNETGEEYWRQSWRGDVEDTSFKIPLRQLKHDTEYVIQLLGEGITYTRIQITSSCPLLKEQIRPRYKS